MSKALAVLFDAVLSTNAKKCPYEKLLFNAVLGAVASTVVGSVRL